MNHLLVPPGQRISDPRQVGILEKFKDAIHKNVVVEMEVLYYPIR